MSSGLDRRRGTEQPLAGAAGEGDARAATAVRVAQGRGDSGVSLAASSSSSSSSSSADRSPLPSYSYLVFSHVIALLPTAAFLITFGVLSLRQRCRLPLRDHSDEDSRLSYAHCSRMLGPSSILGWSFFAMGLTGYAAVNKIRSLISRASALVFRVATQNRAYGKTDQGEDSKSGTILTCALRAAFTEAFRIPLIVTATAVVLAELTLRNHNRQQEHTKEVVFNPLPLDPVIWAVKDNPAIWSGFRWSMLDARDARFRVAVWLALGWGTANFLTGSVKLLRNLTLYTPLYLDEEVQGEVKGGSSVGVGIVDEEAVPVSPTSNHRDVEGDPRTPGSVYPTHLGGAHSAEPSYTHEYTEGDSIYRGQVPETRKPAIHQRPGHSTTGSRFHLTRPRWLIRSKSGRSTRRRRSSSHSGHQASADIAAESTAQDDYFGAVVASGEDADDGASDDEAASERSMMVKLEDQIDRLVAARRRVKLEQSLGASLPELPAALAALWRLDDALWSVGSIMLIASAVAIGQGPILSTSAGTGNEVPSIVLHHRKHHSTKEATASLWPDLEDIAATYAALSILHSGFNSAFTLALASLGWPVVTYSSLLVGIAIMVAGLARWGLVV